MEGDNKPTFPRRRAISIQSGIKDRHTGIIYEEPESALHNNRSRNYELRYIIQRGRKRDIASGISWWDSYRFNDWLKAAFQYERGKKDISYRNGVINNYVRILQRYENNRYRVLRTHKTIENEEDSLF